MLTPIRELATDHISLLPSCHCSPVLSLATPVLNAAAADSSVQALAIDKWFLTVFNILHLICIAVQFWCFTCSWETFYKHITEWLNSALDVVPQISIIVISHLLKYVPFSTIFLITNTTCTSGTGVIGQMQMMIQAVSSSQCISVLSALMWVTGD